MRGVVKTQSGHFEIVEVAAPVPTSNQLLIDVQAFSINFGEIKYSQPDGSVPGWDAAGVVTQSPAGGPQVGQRVVTFGRTGGWAEQHAVNLDEFALLPDSVEIGAAASLPVAGVTALRALRRGAERVGGLDGKRVLITGASGGVGRFAVQLAHQMGGYVIALVGRPERGVGLDALGADEILVGTGSLSAPIDVVLDNVGGDLIIEVLEHTREGAPVLSIGGASGQMAQMMENVRARVIPFTMGSGLGDDLLYLVDLLAEGRLDPQIGWRGDWSRIDEATQALINRQVSGKAVLDVKQASVSTQPG